MRTPKEVVDVEGRIDLFHVRKRQIEHSLRLRPRNPTGQVRDMSSEFEAAVSELPYLLPNIVFAMARNLSIVRNFSERIGKRCEYVDRMDSLKGLRVFTIVLLGRYMEHARSAEMLEMLSMISDRRKVTVWTIGEWR